MDERAPILLYYIGGDFYHRSSTHMSCIYTAAGERYDWGAVEAALKSGFSIVINPAPPDVLIFYHQKLSDIIWKRLLDAKAGNPGA